MKLEREDILARLRAGLPALKRQFPLHGLSLFGSVVRGEDLAESDIDVVADVDLGRFTREADPMEFE